MRPCGSNGSLHLVQALGCGLLRELVNPASLCHFLGPGVYILVPQGLSSPRRGEADAPQLSLEASTPHFERRPPGPIIQGCELRGPTKSAPSHWADIASDLVPRSRPLHSASGVGGERSSTQHGAIVPARSHQPLTRSTDSAASGSWSPCQAALPATRAAQGPEGVLARR
ncbi:hypothetical protein NDU88_001913 [Pleurodeles waltl]|uniref:Uncharacterized protein n=1 Tax=Pleurodeles waltl TaxID=8319 RepID=A0AAV7UVN5_PLEWA|nr:hypothetical protein NDU88_001913 [Pleurodeles waltl]